MTTHLPLKSTSDLPHGILRLYSACTLQQAIEEYRQIYGAVPEKVYSFVNALGSTIYCIEIPAVTP